MSETTLRERVEFRAARALSLLSPRTQVRLSGKAPVTIDGNTLDPGVQLTLAAVERRGEPGLTDLDPAGARAYRRKQALAFAGVPVPVGEVRDLRVDGAAGTLPARFYKSAETGGPHPLLVFFHGGGFVIGDLDTHDGACRMLCRHAGVDVLSVEYRKAPEDPFPAAVEDCIAAYRWGVAHAEELGSDPSRVAVGGDSAGANLATVVCQQVRDPAPVLQLLFYPVVDMTERRESRTLFAEGFFLTSKDMDWFSERYATEEQWADPRCSPLLGELEGLPQAYVITAGFDPLRDEGELYAEALRDAGVPVVSRRFASLIHGFINMGTVNVPSNDALVEVAGGVRALLARR